MPDRSAAGSSTPAATLARDEPRPAARPGEAVRGELAVLAAGLGDAALDALGRLVDARVEARPTVEAARERIEGEPPVAVVVTGPGLGPNDAIALVEAADDAASGGERPAPVHLVLAGGPELERFQELIDRDRLFFLSRRPPSAPEVAALADGALERARLAWLAHLGSRGEDLPPELLTLALRRSRQATEVAGEAESLRRLTLQTEPEELAILAARLVRERLGAARAYCLFYDPTEEVLWSPVGDGNEGVRRESAVAGVAAAALKSGRPVVLERAEEDPRYDREADDPAGDGSAWLLAVPLGSAGGGQTCGVLVAVGDDDGGLEPGALERLERLAAWIAPLGADLLARTQGAAGALRGAGDGSGRRSEIFRDEAIDHHVRGVEGRRDVLRLSPGWTRWSYWLLLAMLLATLVFSLVARVGTHVSGPALVVAPPGEPPRALVLLPVAQGGALAAPGMPVRLELAGVGAVEGRHPVGEIAAEPPVALDLPEPLAASLDPTRPMVLVRVPLPEAGMTTPRDLGLRPWRSGLRGTAEVEVRSERLLVELFPALGRLGGD